MEIENEDIEGFALRLRRDGLSDTSVRNAVRAFVTGMNAAREAGLITEELSSPKRLKGGGRVRKQVVWSNSELRAIIEHCDPYCRAALTLGAYGMLRSGEVCAGTSGLG